MNPVNPTRGGVVSVAILTTPAFDAAQLGVVQACFGDVEDPDDRACSCIKGTTSAGIGFMGVMS